MPRAHHVVMAFIAILIVCFGPPAVSAAEKPLTNDDVVAMVKAGLGDDLVIAKIQQTANADFDTSAEALIQMKKQGVSKAVMDAMLKKTLPPPVPTPTTAAVQPVDDQGPIDRLKARFHRSSGSSSSEANPSSTAPSQTPADNRQCVRNYKKDGSFFSGYQFKDFVVVPQLSKGKAFDLLLPALSRSGWQIVSSSKDAGMISASETVSYGEGKTVPLNVTITDQRDSVRIDAILVTSGGVTSSSSAVVKEFCSLFDSVLKD